MQKKFYALEPKIYSSFKVWIGLKKEVARLQARCNEFGHPDEPTQHTRDEASLSRTGVDAHGRKCAWVCLLPQVVDEWVLMMLSQLKRWSRGSFVAVGDRLPVHLNSSYNTACPGDTQAITKTLHFLEEEPEQVGS